MCVAAPVRVVEISGGVLPMGQVARTSPTPDGGVGTPRANEEPPQETRVALASALGPAAVTSCCFAYLPEAQVGDWVLVQNGFAIEVLDERSALESLAAFAELAALADAVAPSDSGTRHET